MKENKKVQIQADAASNSKNELSENDLEQVSGGTDNAPANPKSDLPQKDKVATASKNADSMKALL